MSFDRNFSFGLSKSAERLRQLVNSDYLADVVFKVGTSDELIYAHKNIIILASEVFYAQFNGNFVESSSGENPIVIADIERNTFLQLMYFIYGEEVFLSSHNVLDVYYASKKYLLKPLTEACEDYFRTKIDDHNVLELINSNHQHQFDVVDEKCLAIICDNPLKFFKQAEFLEMNLHALKLVVSSRRMNCYKEQLQDAIEQWRKVNGSDNSDIEPKLEALKCSKLVSYSTFSYSTNINTDLKLTVKNTINLYGLGILVGVKKLWFPEASIDFKINIQGSNTVSEMKTVRLQDKLYTQEILFEKVAIRNECRIIIKVERGNATELFHLNAFQPVDSLGDVSLAVTDMHLANRINTAGMNCVAYLLYNVE